MAGKIEECRNVLIKNDLELKSKAQSIHQCESFEALENLNKNITQLIDSQKSQLTNFNKLANEEDKENNKISILKEIDDFHKELLRTQSRMRNENIKCQLSIEERNKQLLFHQNAVPRKRTVKTDKVHAANAASEITENLEKLTRLMSEQVKRTEDSMSSLISSSQQIDATNDEFRSLSGHIHKSGKLLTKYGRRECMDRVLILIALFFFFATVLYIIKKRLFWPNEAS